jgi:hypothetical protein
MERQLVLEGEEGKVIRAFHWEGKPVRVIRRADTRRLELVASTEYFT